MPWLRTLTVLLGALTLVHIAHGQATQHPPASAPQPAAVQAPPPDWAEELTGYWESVISQNWRLRMVTPPKGEYVGIALTPAAELVADAWDPARDTARGLECKSYGAATIMMNPEHLHIVWQDRETLKVEIDNGTQTQLLHFGAARDHTDAPSWQGSSTALWLARGTQSVGGIGPPRAPNPNARYLEITTRHMRPGYLRKNGVPYGERAELIADYDLVHAPDGENWLVVTTRVTDPDYLEAPLLLSAVFKKQADGSSWDPTPCSATW